MKIAIDYDETFTADPRTFKKVIDIFKLAKHEVNFVTYRDGRHPNHDISADAQNCGVGIIFTAGKQKRHIYDADIWIDDSPETIVSFEQLGNMYDGCLANNDLG